MCSPTRGADYPNWYVSGVVSDDGHYLIIEAHHGDEVQNTLLVQDLTSGIRADHDLDRQTHRRLPLHRKYRVHALCLTDDGAPRCRLIGIDLAHFDREHWRTLVSEGRDTLVAASLVGDSSSRSTCRTHSAVAALFAQGQAARQRKSAGTGHCARVRRAFKG